VIAEPAYEVAQEPDRKVRAREFVEWLIIAFAALCLFGKTLPHAWHTLNTDFPNYYLTARL
jgi:hypothetical protein